MAAFKQRLVLDVRYDEGINDDLPGQWDWMRVGLDNDGRINDPYNPISIVVVSAGAPVGVVFCKICEQDCDADTAHQHGSGYVGDECCWDERLRATE